MAITDAFPGASGTVDSVELRKDLAGLIVRDTAGLPRAGVFPRHTNALVTSTATTGPMTVSVAAFEGASVRGGGPLFQANDGVAPVTITTAPVSNSRIDVVYFKQNESAAPFADANNLPVLAVLAGTAAASPVKPSLAAIVGAVELATVLVPTGATATNSGGVIITNTFQWTAAAGGVVVVRNLTELGLWLPGEGSSAFNLADSRYLFRIGGVWKPLVEDTGWIALPLSGAWINFGGAYGAARYRRVNGMTEVTGLVKGGSAVAGAVIGNLPVGFLPASFAINTVWGNGGACSVEVGPSGAIVAGDTGVFTLKTSLVFRFPAEG